MRHFLALAILATLVVACSDSEKELVTIDPFNFNSIPSINISNKNNFSANGTCTFTGEVTVNFVNESQQTGGIVSETVICEEGEWSLNPVDLTSLDDGDIQIKILKGEEDIITPITILKDVVTPTFTVTTMFGQILVPSSTNQIELTGTCDNSGEAIVSITELADRIASRGRCDNGSWVVAIDFTGTDDGDYTLEIVFTDSAGNQAASTESGVVTRDITAPSVSNLTVSGGVWTWGCSDISGCSYRYQVTNSATFPEDWPTGASDFDTTTALNPAAQDPGIYYIHVQAKDKAGNMLPPTSSGETIAVLDEVRVTGVNITGNPVNDYNRYNISDTIDIEVTFSELVRITGSPQLILGFVRNSTPDQGIAHTGTGDYAMAHTFRYTVAASHNGALRFADFTHDASNKIENQSGEELNYDGISNFSTNGFIVDNTPPRLLLFGLSDDTVSRYTMGETITVYALFDKAVIFNQPANFPQDAPYISFINFLLPFTGTYTAYMDGMIGPFTSRAITGTDDGILSSDPLEGHLFTNITTDLAGNTLMAIPTSFSSFPNIYIDSPPVPQCPSAYLILCTSEQYNAVEVGDAAHSTVEIFNAKSHNQIDFHLYLDENIFITNQRSIALDLLADKENAASSIYAQVPYQSYSSDNNINDSLREYKITFRHTVQSTDSAEDFYRDIPSSPTKSGYRLNLGNGGSIRDFDNAISEYDLVITLDQSKFLSDFRIIPNAPEITSVAVTSTTYDATSNANIDFTVTYDLSVDVYTNSGLNKPYLEFIAGGSTKRAHYESGDNSIELIFRYVVQPTDVSSTGIEIDNPRLHLGGGKINTDIAVDGSSSGDDAILKFTAPNNLGSINISNGNLRL